MQLIKLIQELDDCDYEFVCMELEDCGIIEAESYIKDKLSFINDI